MKPLCIYHGNCDDGFGAAWVVNKALAGECEFYPGVYQKAPPDVTGRDVIMVDFSYKAPVLHKMAAQASTLVILDHHKTAAEDLKLLPPLLDGAYNPSAMLDWQRECNAPASLHALFDMERSGAGITWDYFIGGKRDRFIDYLEDRDLWRKTLPSGDEFTIALRSYPQDFETWDRLISAGVGALIEEGRGIQRYYRLRVEELKRNSYSATLSGRRARVSNSPYFAASEVAGELCGVDDAEFGACYFEGSDGRCYYSLRSRGDFDVSAIALNFGGGGHKNAAGFSSDTKVHTRIIQEN